MLGIGKLNDLGFLKTFITGKKKCLDYLESLILYHSFENYRIRTVFFSCFFAVGGGITTTTEDIDLAPIHLFCTSSSLEFYKSENQYFLFQTLLASYA